MTNPKPYRRRKKLFFITLYYFFKVLAFAYKEAMKYITSSSRKAIAGGSILAGLISWKITGQPITIMPAIFFFLVAAVALISYPTMLLFADNTGGRRFELNDRRYVMPRKVGKPRRIAILAEGIDTIMYRPATLNEMHDVGIMNMKAFKYTIWGRKTELFVERNKGHVKKNDLSILTIVDGDKILGFTQIVPLDEESWEEYRDGKIKDIDLDHEKIMKKGRSPYGLLLLSMVYPVDKKKTKQEREEERKKIGERLTEAIVFHVHLHCAEYLGDERAVRLMFQTMNSAVRKTFKQYNSLSKRYSKDGAKLICLRLVLATDDDRKIQLN